MNNSAAMDISYFSLVFILLLLAVPFIISKVLNLGIIKDSLYSVFRMIIQLVLIAIFLKFLFHLNNPFVTFAWILVMIFMAAGSVAKKSSLSLKRFILPIFSAFFISNFFILLFINLIIINNTSLLEAKYTIVIMGMLLGNSLKSNIVGINGFYRNIQRNTSRYHYFLGMGASTLEASLPYLRKSLLDAINPTLATMTTVGIVSLPGMMTGQILGGSDPLVAIKYQIAIMIAIYVSSVLSIFLGIVFTMKTAFNKYGVLDNKIFIK